MIVKLLNEQNSEFLSLTGGCTGSSESTHVKMPHCWKTADEISYTGMYGKCSKILNTFFVLISNKKLFFRAGIPKILVKLANREYPDQTASSEAVCFFFLGLFGGQVVFEIFEHLPYNWAGAWDFQQCGMCDQQSLRSACAYAQSDQSLC